MCRQKGNEHANCESSKNKVFVRVSVGINAYRAVHITKCSVKLSRIEEECSVHI